MGYICLIVDSLRLSCVMIFFWPWENIHCCIIHSILPPFYPPAKYKLCLFINTFMGSFTQKYKFCHGFLTLVSFYPAWLLSWVKHEVLNVTSCFRWIPKTDPCSLSWGETTWILCIIPFPHKKRKSYRIGMTRWQKLWCNAWIPCLSFSVFKQKTILKD